VERFNPTATLLQSAANVLFAPRRPLHPWVTTLWMVSVLACTTEPLDLPTTGPSITTSALQPARAGQDYIESLSLEGGQAPYTWELVDPGPFKDWLKLGIGQLMGKPTAQTDEAPITILVRDAAQQSGTKQFLLSVGPCPDGLKRDCAVSVDGACKIGKEICHEGDFGACTDLVEPSSSLEACGPSCTICQPGGDRCLGGKCYCGVGGDPCPEGTSCCNDPSRDSKTGKRCADIQTDPDACGGCNPCRTDLKNVVRTCEVGKCVYPCAAGYKNCSSDPSDQNCVTHVAEDTQNCGSCGNVCGALGSAQNAVASCVGGRCQPRCASDYASCGVSYALGCPFNLKTDAKRCGACDNDCTARPNVAVAACENGGCRILACVPGFGDCDGNPSNGCEATLGQLPNCGFCGNTCQGLSDPGFGVAGVVCQNFSCGIGQCVAGRSDCNLNVEDGCETPLNTNSHCGRCGNACTGTNGLGIPYLCNTQLGRCCLAGGSSGCQ